MRRRGTSVNFTSADRNPMRTSVDRAAAAQVQCPRQAEQQNRLLYVVAIAGVDHFHGTILHRGARFSQIARNRRDQPPLLRRVTQDFRVGNDVVGMAVAAVAVHVVAHFIEHGRGREPFAVFRRQAVQRTQA